MVKLNAMLYARVVSLLVQGPTTVHDICAETGLHTATVASFVRELRKVGLVGIGAWERDSRGIEQIPVYEWGRKRDKPRSRMTPAQRQQLHRARRVASMLLQAMAGPA